MMFYKAKSIWYSITPSNVFVTDIWGDKKKVATQNQNVPVLNYVFIPDSPGTYNWNPRLQNDSINWGGMMQALSSTANDLQAQNIQYIEFWMKVDNASPDSKIYIDLGRISEAVIPTNSSNILTEDRNNNGVVDQGEDTGIDEMFDPQERDSLGKLGYSRANFPDPSGDNFSFNNTSHSSSNVSVWYHINGTQGNHVLTDIGRIPDTEDLNLNGNLDKVDSYFRYTVPLDTNEAKKEKIIAGGGNRNPKNDNKNEGWYLYRIPLQNSSLKIGNPSLSDVEYIRLFTTGETDTTHVEFAEFNLTGNQWEQARLYDTVMAVSVINVEDNPSYVLPPGITQVRDLTQPNQNVYSNEQSLDLIVKGLQPDSSREAVKYLYKSLDLFNYRELKFFVHGDETPTANIADTSEGGYSAQLFFRFGTDTNNFYEYRQPIKKGWNDVDIPFSSLTAIKQRLDSANIKHVYNTPIPGHPGDYYGIKGNPSLTSAGFFSIGILNVSSHPIKGEVWIDELRVIGADNHPGWAYSFATSLKLADLMTVNFNMSETDPYFHSLSTQFGSRVNSKSWNLSTSLNVLKLLPFNMPGSSLNLSYSHSESIGKPLYIPGTDIKVSQAALIADERASNQTDSTKYTGLTGQQIITNSQSVNVSDSWSASNIAFRIPSASWIVNSTFNALSFGFNYNKTFSRSPTVLVNKSWQWNANMNYAVTLSRNNYIYAANIPIIGSIFSLIKDYRNLKIYYSPQNINFSLAVRRNRSFNENTPVNNSPLQAIYSHDFTTSRNFNSNWKLTDGGLFNVSTSYSMSLSSSLAFLEFNADKTPKPESEVWRKIFAGNFFGNDYQFSQNLNIQTSPKLPTLWNIDRYFNLSASYSVSYRWSNNFAQKEAGRSAGFSNQSSVGLNLALKALTDPLFAGEDNNSNESNNRSNQNTQPRGNFRQQNVNRGQVGRQPQEARSNVNDTAAVSDTSVIKTKKNTLRNAWLFVRSLSRILFFDYESININFTNSNSVSKGALIAEGTGLYNFFGLSYNRNNGPPRMFMLGLNSDVGNIRAPGQSITDVYAEQNNLTFQTSKPLWEGAKINLNWKIGWTLNKSVVLNSDTLTGMTTPQYINSTGTISRTFFSLPPVSLLSIFKSGISRVHDLYNPNAADPEANLSKAFTEGFESLPLLSRVSFLKDFADYIPRPNWSISWDGLEKYWPFKMFTERASLSHAYTSQYSQGWSLDPNGNTVVQTQTISYGFNPLFGLNMTFAKLWNGNLSGSIKYSTTSNFSLGVSTQNITESYQKDVGISATYTKTGFEIPLFGVSLKNDIEFTFSYTNSQSTSILYEMNKYKDGGIPQNGTSRITIEPRVKYTISSKVTISIFYQKTTTEPVGASRVPPITSNTAGLDVHISIQ
jgi:cell surface protein SprA